MTQSIRRSQFITTYGPGAVLEGAEGPRVIKSLDASGLFQAYRPAQFEITDSRLSQTLLGGARILRLPSNAELGRPDSAWTYETGRFPAWSLCIRHNRLYRKQVGDNFACPACNPAPSPSAAWRQAGREAIRFVRACEAGHLDDVDWPRLVPHSTAACNPGYLIWRGGGGALRNIDIACPTCGASINLGYAYSRTWQCSGRHPEAGTLRPGCPRDSKIVQRGAANLRLSELQSALTIPPRATPLHRMLEMTQISSNLFGGQMRDATTVRGMIIRLVTAGLVPRIVGDEVTRYDDDFLEAAVADILDTQNPADPSELRRQEFNALRQAALHGAPPTAAQTPGAPHQFEVVRADVREIRLTSGRLLRITPVNRLRVVMVQTGYRRLSPTGSLVDISLIDGVERWYPGVELFGEGVFIDMPDTEHANEIAALRGESYGLWQREHAQAPDRDLGERVHPRFVWWHTLSHRLISALSIDSGYSSAAIRERVYINIDSNTGNAFGGVLLYTVQPGGDGTLGGLVGLVPQFERVLRSAFRNLDACSNDPLCSEERMSPGRANGSACYSCALVSETSCEHRNQSLDRTLLLENLP